MHILCTICSDLVNAVESVCVTKCGHIFHHHCLAQWNERSKTCPQCRRNVTQKCIFRVYPTISNDTSVDDVTTLQSRLDDAKLTTRQQIVKIKEMEEKVAALTEDFKKTEKILRETEKRLVIKDSAVSALKGQLEYVKIQNKETQRLKDDNVMLHRNLETLNGLQKVLNATTEEVGKMLESYSDVRTIATFAAALKRALCESECKKNESRDRVVDLQQQLSMEKQQRVDWQHRCLVTQEKLKEAEETLSKTKLSRKALEVSHNVLVHKCDDMDSTKRDRSLDEAFLMPATQAVDFDTTFLDDSLLDITWDKCNVTNNKLQKSMVNRIESSDSPYLALKQSSLLPLSAIQRKHVKSPPIRMKPSDFVMLNRAKKENAPSASPKQNLDVSIFHTKAKPRIPQLSKGSLDSTSDLHDGFGGHFKLDQFPVRKSPVKSKSIPILTAKHKLKRPIPPGTQDIGSFLKKMKDK